MIDRLIAVLQQDSEVTAEEIADIFWLTLIQHQSEEIRVEAAPQVDEPSPETSERDSTTPEVEVSNSPVLSQPAPASDSDPLPAAELALPQPQTAERPQTQSPQFEATPSLPFQVPDPPALRGAPALVRALRPLQRQIPSSWASLLDEEATTQSIAETQIWLPVLQADLEPWLDVALVVDASASMLIWRRTVLEFQRLLSQYGFFRDVRIWSLDVDDKQVSLRPGLYPAASRQAPRSPQELLDPKGRRLVLVMSDCVAEGWQTGAVSDALQVWADQGPTALVQVLPEWLWDRTALRQIPTARLHSLEPGVANRNLVAVRRDRWRRPSSKDIKLPVLTLEAGIVRAWSQMVAGQSNQGAPGFVLSPERRPALVAPADLDPKQQMQRFRVFASPMARRLAGLLAAAPVISLPVIRLIQEARLRQSQQVHVAEVLLSGLFKPAATITPDTHPDEVEYEFCDEAIRQSLREETPAPDLVRVLSELIERKFNETLEVFIANLRPLQLGILDQEQDERQGFARVAIDVLKRRGGRYAEFARGIEQQIIGTSAYTALNQKMDEIMNQIVDAFSRQDYQFRVSRNLRELQAEAIDEVAIADDREIAVVIVESSLRFVEGNQAVFDLAVSITFSTRISYFDFENSFPNEIPTFDQVFPNQTVNATANVVLSVTAKDPDEVELESVDLRVEEPISVDDFTTEYQFAALESLEPQWQTFKFDEAIAAFERQIGIAEALDDQASLAIALNRLGRLLQQQGKFDEASNAFERQIGIAEALNDQRQLAIGLNCLGGLLQQQGKFDEAIAAFERQIGIAEALNNQASLAIALNRLGRLLQQQGKLDEAIATFERQTIIFEAIGDRFQAAIALHSLGTTLKRMNRMEEAVDILQKSRDIFTDFKDNKQLLRVLNTLGGVLEKKQDWKAAENVLREGYDLANKENDILGQAVICNSLGQLYAKREGKDNIFLPRMYFLKSIELGKQANDQVHLAKAYTAWGQALIDYGMYENAVVELSLAFDIEEQLGSTYGLRVVTQKLIPVLVRLKRRQEALNYYDRAIAATNNNPQLVQLKNKLSNPKSVVKLRDRPDI